MADPEAHLRHSQEEPTRARLLDAGRRLFVRHGYHGTSMRQIAREADLALGGVYNHFSGKEDLFVTVLLENNPYLSVVAALDAARGETAEALIRDAAVRMQAALGDQPEALQLMFVEIVDFKGRHFPRLFERLFPQTIGFAQRLTQSNGALRDMPLPTLIRTFFGFFFAYFMTEWLMGEQLSQGLTRDAFDDFVEVYLHGVLTPEREG
ncbi:MAG: helix-turn-helix domain-containing protein [Anaerolineae bacterium]|jgi:AcrR family transcriptional regulator